MLQNITLGQYFPGNSPVHRLDARYKILLTFIFLISVFFLGGIATHLVCVCFVLLVIMLSRISLKVIGKSLAPIAILICITALLNIFYTPGQELVHWWIFRITREGLISAARMIVRIIMLVAGSSVLTYTTSPIMLTEAIEQLLNPMKKFRLPVHEIAMMMTIALRFIPTLIEETDKIISAQKARGADFDSGNVISRIKAMIPILIPLFISAFRRADDLALAMECRCYHGGEGRTRLHRLKASGFDNAVLILTTAFLIGLSVAGRLGF